MKKGLKYLETQKVVIYSELLTAMIGDMDAIGMQATNAHNDKQITEKVRDEIHIKLVKQIEIIEPKRIELVKELNKRVKADVGLNRGPSDLGEWLHTFKKDYPDMFLTKAEFEFKTKTEKKKEKQPVPETIKLKKK